MTGEREITNGEDIIDSREVIERIAFLESIRDDDEETGLDDDEAAELELLTAFAEDASEVDDWPYGETFIRESYFQDYAQELADDIGAIPSDASWPLTCIDWEQAARELQMDYTAYSFDGVTYYARA